MIKCCVASILILCITSGAAFAEALPRPGHIDSRVRDVVYNKDNVTAIDARISPSRTLLFFCSGVMRETRGRLRPGPWWPRR